MPDPLGTNVPRPTHRRGSTMAIKAVPRLRASKMFTDGNGGTMGDKADTNAAANSVTRERTQRRFPRPHHDKDALQAAIARWVAFNYYWWHQTRQSSLVILKMLSMFLRISLITLAGIITILSSGILEIQPAYIPILSGAVTILAGIEAYLKLDERKIIKDNRNREILSEKDRLTHEWIVKVELEIDDHKALNAAKNLLEEGPKRMNGIVIRYMSRIPGEKPSSARQRDL